MNNGHIIGSMAVGALLAPVTGGISLVVALAGVSGASIVSKMGEEWEEETTTEEETRKAARKADRKAARKEARKAGRKFVNGRLVRS